MHELSLNQCLQEGTCAGNPHAAVGQIDVNVFKYLMFDMQKNLILMLPNTFNFSFNICVCFWAQAALSTKNFHVDLFIFISSFSDFLFCFLFFIIQP